MVSAGTYVQLVLNHGDFEVGEVGNTSPLRSQTFCGKSSRCCGKSDGAKHRLGDERVQAGSTGCGGRHGN